MRSIQNILLVAIIGFHHLAASAPLPLPEASDIENRNWIKNIKNAAGDVVENVGDAAEKVGHEVVKDTKAAYKWTQSDNGKKVINKVVNDGKKVYEWSQTPTGQAVIGTATKVLTKGKGARSADPENQQLEERDFGYEAELE